MRRANSCLMFTVICCNNGVLSWGLLDLVFSEREQTLIAGKIRNYCSFDKTNYEVEDYTNEVMNTLDIYVSNTLIGILYIFHENSFTTNGNPKHTRVYK